MKSVGKHRAVQQSPRLSLALLFAVVGVDLACKTSHDFPINGTAINCSSQGLKADDLMRLNFPEITTLILSNNNIQILKNNSFVQHRKLKILECSLCNLRRLEVDALRGLDNLESLNLSMNYLKIVDHAFPPSFFRHVPNLVTLNIGGNRNNGHSSRYSNFIDIFDSLPRLRQLMIDSFSNLRIGYEFTKLKKLNYLEVNCENLEKMTNDSFEGFQYSNVKHFALFKGILLNRQLDEMAFQYLPNISSLRIDHMMMGNKNTLRMMKPLQGKSIDEINFNTVVPPFHQSTLQGRIEDSKIDSEATKYLKNVCVHRFTWRDQAAVSIASDAFYSDVWRLCLKQFNFIFLGSNPMVDLKLLLNVLRYRNIQSIVAAQRSNILGTNFWTQNGGLETSRDNDIYYGGKRYAMPGFHMHDRNLHRGKRSSSCDKKINWFPHLKSRQYFKAENDNPHYVDKNTSSREIPHSRDSTISAHFPKFQNRNSSMFEDDMSPENTAKVHAMKRSPIMRIYLPPRLKTIVMDRIGTTIINTQYLFQNNALETIYMTNNHGGGIIFEENWLGLNRLMTLDFTNTKVFGAPAVFKWFPSLSRLVLKNAHRDSEFFAKCAENRPSLKYYDISSNNLFWLPENAFHANRRLKYLNVGSNRFSDIPFDLKLTPNLEILDLRENSLVEIPYDDRQALDALNQRVPNTSLLLDNNPFSCTCSSLPFLKWLKTSTIQFDQGGNYTCMSEDGALSYTGSYSDIKSFWRQCQGRYYFLTSLILVFTLMTLYLLVYLGTAHKTQIVSKVMQLVASDFQLKTRKDFTYDVCIGYADQDGEYVRNTLLRYLEDVWRLRTFVHQRDLLQDPLMMSEAIQDSWRNVLLITESFLDRYIMAHNIMKVATFFVNPSNPRSVVVMVTEGLRHQIPDYVLRVVDDDNIIVVPALEPFLDYETKETLKNRIF